MSRLVSLSLVLALGACAPDPGDVPSREREGPETFEATGTIVSVEEGFVLIDHDDIPGFMDAMTMSFPLADASLVEGLERGTRVAFRVVVDGASYQIDYIEPRE